MGRLISSLKNIHSLAVEGVAGEKSHPVSNVTNDFLERKKPHQPSSQPSAVNLRNTIHFILQGKGGIGKTLVSTMLAQWLKAKNTDVLRCYDTDQENSTFTRYRDMDVKHVPVMTESRTIDPKRFDALMIDLLENDGNCVIDNGANTFSPLLSYLLESHAFEMLYDSGRKVYIHTIVGGGDTLHDTASGFVTTAKSTSVPLVLWENEHFGLLQSPTGKLFSESNAFNEHAEKVCGCVKLAQRNSDTFGADIKKMNTGRFTLEEVLASDKFNVMEKQRIKTIYREVFEQLDHVSW